MKSEPIVVLGGGFGGLSTVIALLANSDRVPIVLIDQSPRFLFKPLMYELLSGELRLWEVAPKYSSLASELGFIFLQDSVVQINLDERKLITSLGSEVIFSQLVLSTGVTTDYSAVDGLSEYGCGFSNLKDVRRVQNLIAKINSSTDQKNPIVIAGAGPTGVELACKIADLVYNSTQICLIDKGAKILPNCKSFNRETSIESINKRNIKLYLNHTIKSVNQYFLELSCNEASKKLLKIKYSDLFWTAGSKPNASNLLDQFLNGNQKIKVNEFLQIEEYQDLFFVGDISLNESKHFPASAQVAMQQGFITAQNIISHRNGFPLKSFEFEDRGEMLSLGLGNASITSFGITLAGPLAFEIRRLAYLTRMPGCSIFLKSTGSWLFSKKLINSLFFQYR